MKRYKTFLIFIICVMLAGFSGSIIIMQKYEPRETDTVLLNDIVQTAKAHMDDLEQMNGYDFGVKYILFDAHGEAVFSSSGFSSSGSRIKGMEAEVKNLQDVIRKQYPYMMIVEDEKLVGSAAILESQKVLYKQMQKGIWRIMALSGSCMCICMILWGIYVKKSVVEPFQRMEKFAGEVAAGNLDAPLAMEKDNLFGTFSESFDIMREELAKAKEKEILMKKQEKELIASLSHDLKTPVTGIKLTAELMMAQTADAGSNEKLHTIYKKAEQIDALVSDLFTSALKDLGEMKVVPGDEESAILHEFVKRCDDRKLVGEGEIPECIIKIDKRRMEQIVGNIISNSYKYANTPIHISYMVVERYLKMIIRDFGPGVSEDEIKLVTNKFYRSKATSHDQTEGSGLGLYIAKTLIEKMNGEIKCLNADPGFEIWLFIPLS